MTENSKIFLTKNIIFNTLAEQQLSIVLSLYIIKDIEQELSKMYNNIITQQLQNKEKEEQIKKEKDKKSQIIDMTKSGLTITSFEDIKDQAD